MMTQQSSSGNQSPRFPRFFQPGALSESEIGQNRKSGLIVISAQAGIQYRNLDYRLRGNDGPPE
jgi:hypothetical protein